MKDIIKDIEVHYNFDTEVITKELKISLSYWYKIKQRVRKPSSKLIYTISKKLNRDFEEVYIFFTK